MLRLLDLLLLQAAVMFTAAPVAVRSQATLTPTVQTVAEDENAIFACSPLIMAASPFLNTIDPGSDLAEALIDDSRLDFIDYPNGDPSPNRTFIWLDTGRVENGRRFFCTISDTTSAESTLYINFGPKFSITPQDMYNVSAGDRFEVVFGLAAHPDPSVVWTLNGNQISSSPGRSLSANGLNLTSVAVADRGTYSVTVTNEVNSTTASFELIVRFQPIFNAEGTVVIPEGSNGVIDCSTVAFPDTTSTMLTRGGSALELDGDNTHTISNATLQDVGVYTCTATNEVGTSRLDVTLQVGRLQVGSLPGLVSNIKFEKFNTNEFTFSWDAADGNGADVRSYDIVIAYGDKEVEYMVNTTSQSSATTISLANVKLGEDDKEEKVVLRITVTAVNGVGRGESTTENFTVTLGKSSSLRSTGSQAVLGVLCVMCVALVLL